MSLKYTCPSCGTPLGYEGLCWKCKCEQERQAALAWMPEQIVEKQRNLIQNIQRLADKMCIRDSGITSLLLSPLLLFIGILVFCLPMPDNMSRKDTENARRK